MSDLSSKITIRHVAEAAGVSISTVSRVLNHRQDVATATIKRVERVIDELGYATNLAARSMRSQNTNVIGVITPEIESYFCLSVMRGVGRVLKDNKYDLLVYTTGTRELDTLTKRDQWAVSLLNSSVTDGVIVIAPRTINFKTDRKIVVIEPNTDSPDYPSVFVDNHKGGMLAMNYLLSLGHRRIGFLTGMDGFRSADKRFSAYRDALAEAGIAYDEALVDEGCYVLDASYASAKRMLSLPNRPTAIFASCDLSAVGAMKAAKELHLSVPEELSIMGFDNSLDSQLADPKITTVDQRIECQGAAAAELMLTLLSDSALTHQRQLEPKLVVRESCAPVYVR